MGSEVFMGTLGKIGSNMLFMQHCIQESFQSFDCTEFYLETFFLSKFPRQWDENLDIIFLFSRYGITSGISMCQYMHDVGKGVE